MRRTPRFAASIVMGAGWLSASADYTKNIMLTGYWPPTNEMIRHFSPNPEQNPDGWMGRNWENRGYDIYAYFPEFPDGDLGRGVGDLEVDYQDTSADFWRLTDAIDPIAIVTFSRGSRQRGWEVEAWQRNLAVWVPDFDEPFQPTPAPPDDSVPADYVRRSSLPMQEIVDAINEAALGFDSFISYNYGGGFLSEFIAYHGTWYHALHRRRDDAAWNVAAGHIHVDPLISAELGRVATEITLREVISYVDEQIPEPASGLLLIAGALALRPGGARRGRGA